MEQVHTFTHGKILEPLIRFTLPVLLALCLQAMYGAVDLLVVGQFSSAAQVSAVSTGSQLLQTITALITGLAMGTTILLGQRLGEGRADEAGEVLGAAIRLFSFLALLITLIMLLFVRPICHLMQAPTEAFEATVQYMVICSCGTVFIVAYNLLGSIFRGLGDSRTPLFTVLAACILNILGDLLFVGAFHMASVGAALATVIAQGASALLCLAVVRRRGLPFAFCRSHLKTGRSMVAKTVFLGLPIALQELLVSVSFLVILSIVNSLGVVPSAGVGVAEKLCAFIMLIPGSYMQALSAFVAQNIGAGRDDRARRAMLYGMLTSFFMGCVMSWASFFHGDILASVFARDPQVIAAAADYLRAYSIDTLLVSFLFCFIGYFNGCGHTRFSMAQGLIGSFGIRIPVSWLMSRVQPISLFCIGLASPCSTSIQILLCIGFFFLIHRKPEEDVSSRI